MLYRLLGRAGAVKNCYQSEAQNLVASGDWIDITKYENEENENGNQPLFLHETEKPKEPRYKLNQRESGRVQRSSDSKTKWSSDIQEGRDDGQRENEEGLQREDVVLPKKKRGRPSKIKVE